MRKHIASTLLCVTLASSGSAAAQTTVFRADFDTAADVSRLMPYESSGAAVTSSISWSPNEGQPPGSLDVSALAGSAGLTFFGAGPCFEVQRSELWSLSGVGSATGDSPGTSCFAGFQQFLDSDSCTGSVQSFDVTASALTINSGIWHNFDYLRPTIPEARSARFITALVLRSGAQGTCRFDNIELRGPVSAVPSLNVWGFLALACLLASIAVAKLFKTTRRGV